MTKLAAALLSMILSAASMGIAWAQEFPDRPITILCGFTPGAAADAQLRALAKAMSRELRQPVIVENRPGAAGTVAASLVAKARPDGYTFVQVTNTVLRQPFIAPTSYDPIKDFEYLIGVSTFDFGLVVSASSPWMNFHEFIAYARQNPDSVSYSSIGVGSVPHQVMTRIGANFGIAWTHVPYKGSAPAHADLQGGHIQAASDTTGWTPLVEAGKLRLLAVYGEQRLKKFPHVPTLRELGLDIADESPWGLAAPRGVPADRVRIVHDAAWKALSDPDFVATLDATSNQVKYMTTQQYEEYMAARLSLEKQAVDKYIRQH